ncbi:MAG: vWA domain-containing protein [Acidimicrobiales bacterium]
MTNHSERDNGNGKKTRGPGAKHNKPAASDTTLLVLVIDRSGSMAKIRSDMQGGLRTLLEDQKAAPGHCLVTLAQFDVEYEVLYDFAPVADVIDYELVPRGSTALLDAMGRTIGFVSERLTATPEAIRPVKVVFAVITDGLENSSREWTRDQVMKAVKRHARQGWQFTFLGANQDAIQEGRRLGVDPGMAMTFAPTSVGAQAVSAGLSHAVRRYRRGDTDALAYTAAERSEALGGDS